MERQDLLLSENIRFWKKFCRNKLAVAGFVFILFVSVIAILGYSIILDDTPYSNRQCVEIAAKPPGFSVLFFKKPLNFKVAKLSFLKKMFIGQPSEFEYIPVSKFYFLEDSLVIFRYSNIVDEHQSEKFSIKTLCGTGYLNPEQIKEHIISSYIKKVRFILGTDRFGRDMLSRLIIGARISLSVGFIAVFISLLIGVILGALAGYYKGLGRFWCNVVCKCNLVSANIINGNFHYNGIRKRVLANIYSCWPDNVGGSSPHSSGGR
jgi:peptide/nickel transport system permease protein